MKTRSIKKEEMKQEWHLVDVTGVRLGQAAQAIAKLLLGKGKVNRVNYLMSGDNVVVINAAKIDIHPRKLIQKKYYSHSGFPGGLSTYRIDDLKEQKPQEIIKRAVWGMLPKTRQGREIFKNLRIYAGAEYKETAQVSEKVNLEKLL